MYSKETFNTLLTLSLGLTAFNYFASKNKEKKEKEKKETEAVQVEAVKENPKEEEIDCNYPLWLSGNIYRELEDEEDRMSFIFDMKAEDYEQKLSEIPLAETECYIPTKMDSIRSIINNKNRVIHFYDKACRHVDKDDNIISKYFKYLDYCKSGYNKLDAVMDLEFRKIANMEAGNPYKDFTEEDGAGDYYEHKSLFDCVQFFLGAAFLIGCLTVAPWVWFGLTEAISFIFNFQRGGSGMMTTLILLLPVVIYYYYKLCRIFV